LLDGVSIILPMDIPPIIGHDVKIRKVINATLPG
jgi:hypothetical protein